MNSFLIGAGKKRQRGGFSLVEATFSIGLLSFGFLTLAPLLALGLKTARLARDDRATAQIAQTLTEEARQGTLASGTIDLDIQGTVLNSANSTPMAAYTAQSTSVTPYLGNASLTQTTLRVTPIGAPDRTRIYAVVYPTPPLPVP
jgi:uncharacterized protein (TIGR02598 family)